VYLRYGRNPVRTVAALAAVLIVVLSVLAPLIAPTRYDVANLADSLQQPSRRHWLGTDAIGRDVLSRLLYGGHTSLEVVLAVVGMGTIVGATLGIVAGLAGSWGDYAVMRVVEISTAVPPILFAMLLVSILGSGMGNVILALAVTAWIEPCRLMRAQTLALQSRWSNYVASSPTSSHSKCAGPSPGCRNCLCPKNGLCRSWPQLSGSRH
jgi:ABC-type dipeptide/oligopeptide/nickel transport system permease subunit